MIQSDIAVNPPDTIVKYDAPLFVGIERSTVAGATKPNHNENTTKLDDMINAMLPPRFKSHIEVL